MHWGCCYATVTALDIEVDPQRCCLDRRQSDFALQAVVECHMLELESDWEMQKRSVSKQAGTKGRWKSRLRSMRPEGESPAAYTHEEASYVVETQRQRELNNKELMRKVQARGILQRPEEQSRTGSCQGSSVADQPQCPRL